MQSQHIEDFVFSTNGRRMAKSGKFLTNDHIHRWEIQIYDISEGFFHKYELIYDHDKYGY